MKKILVLLLLLIGTTAYADKIDVIKHSRAGGLIDRMNEVIALSIDLESSLKLKTVFKQNKLSVKQRAK